jgi:hypothetical protein
VHRLTALYRWILIVIVGALVLVPIRMAFADVHCDKTVTCDPYRGVCTTQVKCYWVDGNSGQPVGNDGAPASGCPTVFVFVIWGTGSLCWPFGAAAGGPPTPPSPAVLAQAAAASLDLPKPSGHRSPDETNLFRGYGFTWVQLWTFWWTDPGTWRTVTATASVGGVSATVTATPVSLSYDPGDGSPAVSCVGPGRPWTDSDRYDPPSAGACGYQYRQVTDGPITATQTLTWHVTWTGSGGSGGVLPDMSTSTSGQIQVLQIQVVNR